MTLGLSTAARNAMLDALATFAGGSCLLRFYSGSRPATGGTATTLLAELTCNATFADSASGGVLTLNSITSDASADASGTATWFRLVKSGGSTHVLDGSVGTSGSDINMDNNIFVAGATVSITSITITDGNP